MKTYISSIIVILISLGCSALFADYCPTPKEMASPAGSVRGWMYAISGSASETNQFSAEYNFTEDRVRCYYFNGKGEKVGVAVKDVNLDDILKNGKDGWQVDASYSIDREANCGPRLVTDIMNICKW